MMVEMGVRCRMSGVSGAEGSLPPPRAEHVAANDAVHGEGDGGDDEGSDEGGEEAVDGEVHIEPTADSSVKSRIRALMTNTNRPGLSSAGAGEEHEDGLSTERTARKMPLAATRDSSRR
jgi:hypothetical protein